MSMIARCRKLYDLIEELFALLLKLVSSSKLDNECSKLKVVAITERLVSGHLSLVILVSSTKLFNGLISSKGSGPSDGMGC